MTAANVSHLPAATPPPPPKPKKKRASVAAREAEAGDGYTTVEQCGLTMKIPVVNGKVPFKATLRFMGLNDDLTPLGADDNGNLQGTALLLGAEQWSAFLEKDPTNEDFQTIVDQILGLLGN